MLAMAGIAFPAPDAGIMGRRDEIIAGLARLVAPDSADHHGRRAPRLRDRRAHRLSRACRWPSCLPASTEEVAAILSFCNENGVKVVPRGAGTSLAGGAIPQEDAIVLGVAKMNKVLDVNFADRTIARAGRHHEPRHFSRRSATRASSTRPIRRRSSPAPSPATSR